jgi:hypothetical protein
MDIYLTIIVQSNQNFRLILICPYFTGVSRRKVTRSKREGGKTAIKRGLYNPPETPKGRWGGDEIHPLDEIHTFILLDKFPKAGAWAELGNRKEMHSL